MKSKLFEKWDLEEVEIHDPGMRCYIKLDPMIHSDGKHTKQRFLKSDISIFERLINKMMRSKKNTGKKLKAYKIVECAFDMIHETTGENPVEVFIRALENAGQREETIRLRYGGISVPKAVDTSPQRRVDSALMFIAEGAHRSSFRNRRAIEACLASEIIAASKCDVKTYSISKREGRERIAKSAR
jgi:small subunit ribosomal protein S7